MEVFSMLRFLISQ